MSVVSGGTCESEVQKRARLRGALEAGDQTAAVEIARQDLALVRNFANDMLKEIKPLLSLAARRAAIAAAPEEPIVHREFMRALILARKPDEAITHAKSTKFDEPTLQRLFLDLAEEFLAEGRPKQATAALGAMQQSWTLDDEARRVLLKAEVLASSPEEALKRLNGFDLGPQERAVLLQYLAERFEAKGDKAGALNCRQAAAAALPHNFDVVFDYLTLLKSVHGDPQRIIEALEDETLQGADKERLQRELASAKDPTASKKLAQRRAAARLAPGDITIVLEYLRLVLEERGFDAALAALDDAAFDRGDRVQMLRDLGGFLASERKQDLALRCKAEAYQRAPQRGEVLYELVDALLKSAGPAGARAYFAEKAIATDTLLATLRPLASYFTQIERMELAVSCRRMAVHLSPGSPEIVAELAGALMRSRGWAESIAEIDSSELSETDRVGVFRRLADPAHSNLDPALATACREEAARRSGTVGHTVNRGV
jgi:predicted Zn-dependent protease